jgi:hypothetical protein
VLARLALLPLLALAPLVALAPAVQAAPAGAAQASPGSLFVLPGSSGTLKRERGRLRLVLSDAGPVTSFTDRPERRADSMSLRRFVRRWRALGFVADPPNAALVVDAAPRSRDVVILELGRPRLGRHGRVSMPVRPVRGRRPAALRRFLARADRGVAARFGRASLFVDAGGAEQVSLVVEVSNMPASILSFEFTESWTISHVQGQFGTGGVPFSLLETSDRGVLLQSTAASDVVGLIFQVTGTGNAVTGTAQVPAGASVEVVAPVDATITTGVFSIPLR